MSSIIRVKRSTGTVAPASLNFGELGLTVGVGTHGNNGGRLFVGDSAGDTRVVGGRYYTDLLSIGPGLVAGQTNPTTAANGFVAVLDQNRKVDQWNVDNIRIDGNIISSTDTDGHINLDPDGTGEIIIPDDTFLTFGTSQDSKIEYDENGTDQLTFTGADIRINIPTESTTKDTGALIVEGGVGIEKNLNVGGSFDLTGNQTITGNLTVEGNTTLGNASTDLTSITGIVTHTGTFTNVGGVTIDNVGISSNVISTKSGGGNVLYIDPYPDGLSNEGMVVVKGNLQVDGTTTTVDSSSVTVNGAIISLGDVTSNRTVVSAVASGVSTISLDSVVGINTGDIISGSASLPNSGVTTVTAYDTSTKIVTITGTTTSGITSTTQLIVTHAYDSNTDRGISFEYNTGVGTANHKAGFFGFDDSSIASSSSTVNNHGTHANDSRKWTYVPDATISNSVVAGTKGFLDVKGIYYQSGDFYLGGAVYFDSQGLQRSTNAVASPTIISKQILTAVTEVNLTVSAVSVTEGDLISQVTSGAYGVVKTTSSGTTITVIGVEGTFNTANDLLINGTSISRIPSAATIIYTNKPTWTSTLDGGAF
jgi:hypothetical protein